jgi:hypothetical protein
MNIDLMITIIKPEMLNIIQMIKEKRTHLRIHFVGRMLLKTEKLETGFQQIMGTAGSSMKITITETQILTERGKHLITENLLMVFGGIIEMKLDTEQREIMVTF